MLLGKRSRSQLSLRRSAGMKNMSPENDPPPADQDFPATVDGKQQQMKIYPFIIDCALCKSFLYPSRDIFMYRGEAFCSWKCREQLINQDVREEKMKLFLLSMKKKVSDRANSPASKPSGEGGETMAVA